MTLSASARHVLTVVRVDPTLQTVEDLYNAHFEELRGEQLGQAIDELVAAGALSELSGGQLCAVPARRFS